MTAATSSRTMTGTATAGATTVTSMPESDEQE